MRWLTILLLSTLVLYAADRRRLMMQAPPVVAGGGGGEPPGTSLVTSTPSGTERNDFTGCLGFRFVTDGDGMTVSALARWVLSGNSGTHTVRLYDAGGAVVASASINTSGAAANAWKWETITPVALDAGSAYYLTSEETNTGDGWLNTHSITTTSEGTTLGARFTSDCVTPSFSGAGADDSYVGLNLKY